MYIVVVGGGKIGQAIADFFARRGDRVVIIDRKKEVCDFLAKNYDVVVYCGDARSTSLLRDAQVEEADVLYAVTDSDSVNIQVATTAKKKLGVPRVVVRINQSENCERVGGEVADTVVCLGVNSLSAFIEAVVNPEYKYLLRDRDKVIALIRVVPDSPLVGRSIKSIEDMGVLVGVVVREGIPSRPTEDLVLEADDEIVVVGREERVNELIRVLYE
ncbi:MAG: potassium channel family protein [Infirmifilum sp.]